MQGTGSYSDRRFSDRQYSDKHYSDMQYSGSSFRYAVIHDGSLCIMLMSSLAKRAIKHDRLVCIGGVKLAGFGRVSFDAYMQPSRRLTIRVAQSLAAARANSPGHFISRFCHYANERRRREDRGAEERRACRGRGLESGTGCSPPQPIRGLGERRKLPQQGSGRSPGCKGICGILYVKQQMCILTSIMVSAPYSLYANARPSVGPSVYLSVIWVDQS